VQTLFPIPSPYKVNLFSELQSPAPSERTYSACKFKYFPEKHLIFRRLNAGAFIKKLKYNEY
jgi:hypothetical protein